jgi:hypothetical protein
MPDLAGGGAINRQMQDVTDMELWRDYLRQGSEEAFAGLVRRQSCEQEAYMRSTAAESNDPQVWKGGVDY